MSSSTINNYLAIVPRRMILHLNAAGLLSNVSDKTLIKLLWWAKTGKTLNIDDPKGFNEKLQWLKLYDRKPKYTAMVDKYLVREYIRDTIGAEYLIPLLGVWSSFREIDFSSLPDQFVLKCNHNSGEAMCVCKNKKDLNLHIIKKRINHALTKNYYYFAREWPYKNISRRIIAEKYMTDNDTASTLGTLIDYKFYCFNGEPKFLYVGVDDISAGTKGELRLTFHNLDWSISPFYRNDHKPFPFNVDKPDHFEKMIEISRQLSKEIPFVRVDLYYINKQIYFSEMTLYPGAGFGLFEPDEWELKIGEWIEIPRV